MKKFINWLIDTLLPGEFDERQGRYILYRSHYERLGHFVSLSHRITLFASSLPVLMLFIFYASCTFSDPVVDEEGDFLDRWYGILFWALNIFAAVNFFVQQRILRLCERSPYNRPMPRLVYLYLLIEITLFSLVGMFGFAMIHTKMYMLFASALIPLCLVIVMSRIFSAVDIYKNAILDKNII